MNGVQPGPAGNRAVLPSVVLLAGGALSGGGALVGTASTFDGSGVGSAHAAVWVLLLPALAAVVLSLRRPLLGLGLCAGAGLAALGRLVADLSVLTDANTAIRPELFYELTARAQPFSAAAGAGVLVAGDVVMMVAGVLAARAISDRLALGIAPIFDRPPPPVTGPEHGPGLLAQAWAAETTGSGTDVAGDRLVGRADDSGPGARRNALVVAGFVGVPLLLAGSLGLPYSGGYLAARYLPPELGLAGIGSALATALMATIAVLVAAVLPRRLAVAVLGGVAAAAAVPSSTALVVRLAGAPVELTASVPVALAGAVVLVAAGLLGRATPLVDDYDVPSVSALRRLRWIGVALSVLTCVAALTAWRLPQLRYNGGADPVLPGGFATSAPLAAPFLLAALVPLAGAALWSVRPLDAAGRALVAVGWLPLAYAVTQTMYLLGQLVSSASVPNAGFAAPRWTAGPGLWSALAGIALGIGAAVVSALAGRQARDASPLVAQEESVDRSRALGSRVATALSVLTVTALALPAYRTAAGSSATLLVGFDLRSWGVLGLAAGMVTAAIAGGRALAPAGAVGHLLAGAAISVARLLVPASTRAADGFSLRPGWYVGWATTLAFVLAAVLCAFSTRRIELVDAGELEGAPRARPTRSDRNAGPADRPTGGKPVSGISAVGKAAGGKAAGGKAVGGKAADGKAVGGKAAGGKAVGKTPAGSRPVGKKPSTGASSSKAKGRAR